MKNTKVNSLDFAKRLGSYSHGYKVDVGNAEIIFTTGQIALDKDGNVVSPDDVTAQAEFVFQSLEKILNEAGSSLDDVVKATIFLTDMNDFPKISEVRNKYFKNSEPASTLVEAKRFVKDGCRVEIEVIAVKHK